VVVGMFDEVQLAEQFELVPSDRPGQ